MAETETYKYQGSKDPGRGSGPLILKGSIMNPEEVVEIGESVELTDDQAKELRARGLKLSHSAEEPKEKTADEDTDQPETRQQQQRAQRPGNVNAPGSGQAEK